MVGCTTHYLLRGARASISSSGVMVRYLMAWTFVLELAVALPLLSSNSHKSSLLSRHRDDPHPFRCSLPTSKCTSFGSKCKEDIDCFSNHCYNGHCGYAKGGCSKDGEMCRIDSHHTCCSGTCSPVHTVGDCHRLLKLTGSPSLDQGVNLNRQCQTLGVCKAYGDPNPSAVLATPWAVPASDVAAKYRPLAQITFKEGVQVRTDLFVARRSGQTYPSIAADTMKPGGIRDAGVIFFTDDSTVHPEYGAAHQATRTNPVTQQPETVTYCIAPILREGAGGGYYAVGLNCCGEPDNFKFECDDSLKESVKSGLVVSSDADNYMMAQQIIEAKSGHKFHDKTKGIETVQPMFVRMLKDYVAEAQKPQMGYVYVVKQVPRPAGDKGPPMQCVAPIMDPKDPKQVDVEFWAVGFNCCDSANGYHCGEVDKKGTTQGSGATKIDNTGDLRLAVAMAELRYGLKAPTVPMYVEWKAGALVKKPKAF